MTRSRTVIVAGAGIGGLTAALALAAKGFRVVVLEQAERLEEIGAGLQLSPNATRILAALGLNDRLAAAVVAPEALRVRTYRGRDIVRMPLGRPSRRPASRPGGRGRRQSRHHASPRGARRGLRAARQGRHRAGPHRARRG